MTKFIIDLDLEKCSACGACVVACMDQNDIDTQRCETSFRVAKDLERQTEDGCKFIYLATACMHCEDAPCITACPSGCISKDPSTGFTIYDNTDCIGCHSCAMACPFGAPSFNMDGKMQKCDGCVERVKYGYEPACVYNCPTNALSCVTEEEFLSNHVEKSLKKIVDLIEI